VRSAKVLDEGVTGNDDRRRPVCLETRTARTRVFSRL